MIMAKYKVEVTPGDLVKAETVDHVYFTVFRIDGQSEHTDFSKLVGGIQED